MIALTASLAGLALLVALYYHIAICLATARIYHEAYSINPYHDKWPKWYLDATHKRLTHFRISLIRPWNTLNRLGSTMTSEFVIIEFTFPHPHVRLNPKVHTIVPKKRTYSTFN